jgi:hypothetical protein
VASSFILRVLIDIRFFLNFSFCVDERIWPISLVQYHASRVKILPHSFRNHSFQLRWNI